MPKKRKGTPAEMPAREWRTVPSKGLVKAQFSIAPEHEKALRNEAFRRAQQRGSGRPDASEVLREVLDGWIERGEP